MSPSFITAPEPGTFVNSRFCIVINQEDQFMHYENVFFVPRDHFHYRNQATKLIQPLYASSPSPKNKDHKFNALHKYQDSILILRQLDTLPSNNLCFVCHEKLRAHHNFNPSVFDCHLLSLKDNHGYTFQIDAFQFLTREEIRSIMLQLQPGRMCTLIQDNNQHHPRRIFSVRITGIDYSQENDVPIIVMMKRYIAYNHTENAPEPTANTDFWERHGPMYIRRTTPIIRLPPATTEGNYETSLPRYHAISRFRTLLLIPQIIHTI